MKITHVQLRPGSLVGPYRQHSQDGTPHLTYYRHDLLLSFVWDCEPAHPIEVEHGGYGEDLTCTVALDEGDLPTPLPTSAQAWAQWFKRLCDDVANTFPPMEDLNW